MRDHRPIPAVLSRLVDVSRKRVADLYRNGAESRLADLAASRRHRELRAALQRTAPAIIAEVKMASPSKGVFRQDCDPDLQAEAYRSGGCAGISVVTEPEYFRGDGDWVTRIRGRVDVPILRKDFIIDRIQVLESAALGADAILLIARMLTESQLTEFSLAAESFGMEVLFEVHDEADAGKISALTPELVGVNARDLDTFVVDRARQVQLRDALPASSLLVAESGIETYDDIMELQQAGYGAFLVGEALMRADDPIATLRGLRGAS